MQSNKELNPTQCPKFGDANIELEKDYGRQPIPVRYAGMIGNVGDIHCQDWLCRSCNHDWRVCATYGDSDFVIDGGVLKRSDGKPVDNSP